MSENKAGAIEWIDLTVENAETVRDFYREVAGWSVSAVDMGGYSDFCMNSENGQPAGGVCHARGENADLPPQWLIYINVEDLERSMARCREMGGDIIAGPRGLMGGRFCVIRDPAGAVAGLYQPAPPKQA